MRSKRRRIEVEEVEEEEEEDIVDMCYCLLLYELTPFRAHQNRTSSMTC